MSHTPGPWTVNGFGGDFAPVARTGAGVLVSAMSRPGDEMADARLIAAAPDLLAELKHLVRLLEPALDGGSTVPGLATLNRARLVIAKAEGR